MIAAEIKYKKTGIDWIPEVPEHWKLWKVSRAFKTIGSGTTPQSGNLSYYDNGTINWVCTGDLNDDLVETTEHKVTKAAFEKHSALKLFPKGTLLIAMYGATIGKTGILNFDACTNQACCALGDSDVLLTKFVYYWFFVNRPNIVRLSYGGGQPNISQDVIKQLRIQTPPIEEQEQIVSFLDTQSAKITRFIQTKQRFIELLKEQRQSIITNAVTKGIDDGVKMKETGVDWIPSIPENWSKRRLRFLVKITTGKKNTEDRVSDGEYPFYVRSQTIERINSYSFDGEGILTAGDGVGVGKVFHYVNGKFDFHQRVYLFYDINQEIEGEFLFNYLQANMMSELMRYNSKSTVDSIRLPVIKNFLVVFPEKQEQKRILEHIKTETRTLDIAISKAEREIELIKEYREAMIAEAVTGKMKL